MNIEQVRRHYRASPFHPFTLHLADGRNVPVVHPEFMIISPQDDECIVYEPDGTFHLIDVELITDLERKARSFRKKPRNGKKSSS